MSTSNKKSVIDEFRPDLDLYEEIYRDIHRNPELSKQEVRTASIVAKHIKAIGDFQVHEKVGGTGVVGVLRNGVGPTVLLRADMDALPHLENTGLPYASKKIAKDAQGKDTPVMHACGHDMHVTTLMAASTLLHAARLKWSGTLICLFQPNEETAGGARAMIEDGLYDENKFGIPIPDIVLGQHVHKLKAGVISLSPGPILTAVDSLMVRIYGKSGHICRADLYVDPVLIACQIVVRLQGVVTKEVRPEEFAVIGCASIHGGNAPNIIPDFVDLKISIRSYQPEIHERLIDGVKRAIKAECQAAGATREPDITTIMHAPSTVNDDKCTLILKEVFNDYYGDDSVELDPFGASEDFSYLARACNAPYVFTFYGCIDIETWEKAEKEEKLDQLPGHHSALFAPAIQPTMKAAVDAFALSAMTFFERMAK